MASPETSEDGQYRLVLTRLRKWLPYFNLAVGLLLTAFFVGYAIANRQDISRLFTDMSRPSLYMCMLIYGMGHIFATLATSLLLSQLGYARTFRQVLAIHLHYLPAKYLPGGIWHSVGRGGAFIQDGIPAGKVGHLLVLEQVLAIWWSGFLGLLLAAAFSEQFRSIALAALLIWMFISSLSVLFIRKRGNGARLIQPALRPDICAVYVVGWLILAAAFTTYMRASGLVHDSALRIVTGYLLSWMTGALAFFSPQGIGVFEFMMTRTLTPSSQGDAGLAWLIGSYRLVMLTTDILAWLACKAVGSLASLMRKGRSTQ
jgi:hypothetical protein